MNLPQLYYFRKLAEVQHYTQAAKELFITQPSLSDSIASLEKELGVRLFQKKGRNIQLTKYGREFYQYVSESLGILEHGIALLKEGAGSSSGVVDVGCIPTLLGDYLPDVVDSYSVLNPQVHVNVYQGMSIEVAQGVAEGRFDIGFCSMVENQPDLVFVPVTYQELIAIVNKEHPLADRKELLLEELRDYHLTTYRDTIPIGKVVTGLLKEKGVKAAYSYDDEISIGGHISKYAQVAIVADTPFLRQFDDLVKIRLPEVPKDTRMIYMVYSKKNFITSAVEGFANYVVAHALRLP
ncbi:MAG: LysR family transcriptional regulator [Lachnospiraceae bacterium]|nr:LysR family transcriptional regulator [Lachnospiraceae bacterium]